MLHSRFTDVGKYIAPRKATDERETPDELFKVFNDEFHFTLDVCATEQNKKCDQFFSDGSLDRPWSGVCWMNPPYSKLGVWMEKAYQESRRGVTVVCLVPSATDTQWWHRLTPYAEVRFLKGRIRFKGTPSNAPFPSVLVIFRANP